MASGSVVAGAAPGREQAYWTAWTATLIFFAGFYALLVPLPGYLARVGLPDWQIGMILGAFGVASLLGRPLAGVAVDRWGTRPLLLFGAVALIVGAIGIVLTANPLVLGGLRLFQAAGYVAFTTAGTVLVIELTPPDERGRRLAVFGAAANVAITLAPAAATALLEVAPIESGFWAAGGLALLAGVLASLVATPGRPSAPEGARPGSWRFPRRLWLPMATAGLFGAGFAAFFLFAPILSERRGAPAGLLYTLYGIGIILTRLVSSRWIDRAGTGPSLLVAAGLLVVGLALTAVATTPAWLGLAAVLVACGSGLFHPVLIAHHARLLPGAPGRASAAFYLGFDLGIGLGSWLLGVVLEASGLTWLYAAAALLIVATGPLIPVLARQPLPPPSDDERGA
ncbi:MAG: MFS transporter [Chloroflexota bacterium]|nr:MFS transporter [Chloroflexota bacterium]